MNIVAIILIVSAIILGIGSRFAFKKTDNPIEEIAERVIENKTGYKIDLSPDTPDDDLDIYSETEFDFIMTEKKALKEEDV